MDIALQPTVAGAFFAALAVAGGAPLFGDGLRTFRLRRRLTRLRERPLDQEPTGFVHTRGRVVLDSPLFSPLSGRPCAGFRLDVRGGGMARAAAVEQRRPFRIASGETSARVLAAGGRWRLSQTASREFTADEKLSENLAALLQGCSEVAWLRRQRLPVLITERALFAGAEAHVVGCARKARPYEVHPEVELLRTGTDDIIQLSPGRAVKLAAVDPEPEPTHGTALDTDAPPEGATDASPRSGPFGIERRQPGRPFAGEADLWVDSGGMLDFVLVSDSPPAPGELSVSRWRTLGLMLGPALSLSGLIYLAHAAELLRGQGRF